MTVKCVGPDLAGEQELALIALHVDAVADLELKDAVAHLRHARCDLLGNQAAERRGLLQLVDIGRYCITLAQAKSPQAQADFRHKRLSPACQAG